MGVCGCANCGKRFEVMWPHLWAYRRGQGTNVKFLCSWKCLRAYDEQRSGDNVEKRIKLTEAQKNEAYQAAISGGNPLKVLAGFGCKNPSCTWSMIKKQLKKEDPDSYLRLPDKYKPASERSTGKVETPEGTAADAMKGMKDAADEFFGQWLPNAETPEAPKKRKLEHRKTGIDTEIGEFHYYRRNGYLDWSPDGSFQDTVSLKVEEWQALMELFPIVAEELGVEL
jgi:hypothetical protein